MSEWISVEEGRPASGLMVLVWLTDGWAEITFWDSGAGAFERESEKTAVTHWMFIPEPPA